MRERFSYPLLLHRIAPQRYADLSGLGASLYPGRWNRLGEKALYTSTEVGTAILERLVHTPKNEIPSNLAHMVIRVSRDAVIQHFVSGDVLSGQSAQLQYAVQRSRFQYCETVEEASRLRENTSPEEWARVVCFVVPSIVAPAYNFVFYPDAPSFRELVSLESIEPFYFDERLFPETATRSTAE